MGYKYGNGIYGVQVTSNQRGGVGALSGFCQTEFVQNVAKDFSNEPRNSHMIVNTRLDYKRDEGGLG